MPGTGPDVAHEAAEALARANGLTLSGPLVDGDAGPFPYRPYGTAADFPAGWWVALAAAPAPRALRSGTVVGVRKADGAARLLGDASDEG
jgi:hypothetical protein